ncbi:SDR family oxidoreductase [Chitinophaga nivalis]|uniref:dTDP-4-dehydrorhamnose reductase n=1 Tax=Chitinophaga nivalis TaxID=2991709 RepID=A0ABT3IR77_9BACT|nr:SDR family oxidoreductase [Chitinophaga nivalis]MCW3463855.1 SDR family oxidoreductase [Chitinophaga nivalis]MCW3486455.1 SDR family oxidoreductase [Chitinophaga nivalis]
MKILITGSNGLLGQHLIPLLLQDGNYEVVATGRGPNRFPLRDNYTYEAVNLRDAGSVNQLIDKHQPDIIIHGGAMSQVDECEKNKDACWDTNVGATRYLVHAAEKYNAFFIFLSTDFVFDGLQGPYTEESIVNPINYYGTSKVAAERLVHNSKTSWAIVRTVLVYGVVADPHRSNMITWVKNNLQQGKKVKVVDDQWRTPTLCHDLAKGCLLIAAKKATGYFNISGKDMLTPYDMAMQTAAYFKLDPSLVEKISSRSLAQPAARPAKTGLVIDKAIKELGYEPRTFAEGLDIVAGELNA